MALAASREIDGRPGGIEELLISAPLVAGTDDVRRLQTIVRMSDVGPASFEILSAPASDDDAPWQLHVKGAYVAIARDRVSEPSLAVGRSTTRISAAEHQAALAARGLVFGPSLRGIQSIDAHDGESRASIELGADDPDRNRYVLPPALLDASLQALSAAIPGGAARDVAYLPLMVETIRVHRTPGARVTAYASVAEPAIKPSDTLSGRVVLADERGVVAELLGITLRAATDESASTIADDLYVIDLSVVRDGAGGSVARHDRL